MRSGIPVSPGVAIGTAYCINEIFVDPHAKPLEDTEVSRELARYELARDQTAADLRALQRKVAEQVGNEEAAIFGVHESILRDAAFTRKIRNWIVDDRMTAPMALQRLLAEYTELFASTNDPYLRERLADVRDVVVRLSSHLSDVLLPESQVLTGPLIVIADELLPSHVVALGDVDVHGIVTESGSQTSHAAIIARSRGIPAVSGVTGILAEVRTGDTIVVNGRNGHVEVNPEPEALSAYRKLEREFVDLRDHLAENRDDPPLTADEEPFELLANINSVVDAQAARAMGGCGVGLFRTEYLYLMHPNVPDEEEQLAAYKAIIEASPNRHVTIRTLDIGGDKTVPYLGHTHQEANPFLGWRSIRLSFELPNFFLTQIRAILRAAGEAAQPSQVRLLFPMITTLEECRKLRGLVEQACEQHEKESLPFARVPIGMMLEVPAAAVSIDLMLDEIDFVSIGSNDLVQYLMAADRDNPKVSHLCQPLAPAVLRVLKHVIETCRAAEKPITLCGEMAGQPRSFLLLLGMGLRSFSMSPAFIPSIKDLALHVSTAEARDLLDRVLALKTTEEIQQLMTEWITEAAPELARFDAA